MIGRPLRGIADVRLGTCTRLEQSARYQSRTALRWDDDAGGEVLADDTCSDWLSVPLA